MGTGLGRCTSPHAIDTYEPGKYRVTVKPIQPKGAPEKSVDVVVTPKELTEHDVSW